MPDDLEHSHTREAIARRLSQTHSHNYLSDAVYGAIDGTVTTFAVVSGVAGAALPAEIIVILGLANLVGDGFSMAASNYLGTRTDDQLLEKARVMERRHIQLDPEGEREEIRQIFAKKGFSGEQLESVVATITSDDEQWIRTMLTDELGLQPSTPSAIRAASMTFVAFILVGMIPLISFLVQLFVEMSVGAAYLASCVLTGIAFFSVGAAKSYFVEQRWFTSGFETLAVGGTAAGLAYAVGVMLRVIVP
ncbi:MAG: VIT1/CCC1 transporter family protein [Aureliella sp.]